MEMRQEGEAEPCGGFLGDGIGSNDGPKDRAASAVLYCPLL